MAQTGLVRAADGRLRPTLRVALYLVTYVVLSLVLSVVATLVVGPELIAELGPTGRGVVSPAGLVISSISAFAAALATWLFLRFVDWQPWSSVGLDTRRGWLPDLGWGFGLGALLMAGIAAVEVAFGWYQVEGLAPGEAAAGDLLLGLLVYAGVAFGEELVSRGYILQRLAEGWGRRWATLSSAAVFAILHVGNPESGPVPLLGIFVAGVMLAAAYWATGRLWLAIGLHWAWNYFQGPVFGFPVSGTTANGLLRLTPVGPEALTGGLFGPEASLVGVAACLLAAVALLSLRRKWLMASG